MHKFHVTKINCVIDRRLVPAAEAELARLGITEYYSILSKQICFTEKNTLFKTVYKLDEDRADQLRIYAPREKAISLMHQLARAVDLYLPGRGSLYCENTTLFKKEDRLWPDKYLHLLVDGNTRFDHTSWDLITCIVQRGKGDEIARVMLEMGICVPSVCYGEGMGLRDKIGLLRITIPVQKEVLLFLVPSADSDFVLDVAMRRAGMDEPGKGFLYRVPVYAETVNSQIYSDRRKHVASMEQVITALDELQGSTDWRRLTSSTRQRKARQKVSCIELESFSITCEEGNAREIVARAMELGAGGATLIRVAAHHKVDHSADRVESQAWESCELVVRPDQADLLEKELVPLLLQTPGSFAERSVVRDARTYRHK